MVSHETQLLNRAGIPGLQRWLELLQQLFDGHLAQTGINSAEAVFEVGHISLGELGVVGPLRPSNQLAFMPDDRIINIVR